MKTLAAALISLVSLTMCMAAEPTIVISDPPEWQKQILNKVEFRIESKTANELFGTKADQTKQWQGFLIFSCTVKEKLSKRLLWITAEVEFTNGAKRKFESITFNALSEGIKFDIKKIPFETTDPVSVKSVTISSVAMK